MATEEELFQRGIEVPPEQRAAYLDRVCSGDPGMRARVDALLRAHEATAFMKSAGSGHHSAEGEEKPGDRIDRYRLVRLLGEGGFGTVWLAEQVEPVTRLVALKILKPGMDTREVIARFEAERQALALMNHPSIATVHDAGATERGRLYFVMEWVDGLPINRFCDQHRLTNHQRLELFASVCAAVNHAHQKGVIHRDLKPSNILVAMESGTPVPKIIDFGIAKSVQGRLTERPLLTRIEQFIGTPAYMSPEQTLLNGRDVDTRSDIYALGVLLFELLTGTPPFDPATLLAAGFDEMRRVIRETEPPPPSDRLRLTTVLDRSRLASARQIPPDKLPHLIPRDLDWIVLKAIEKSPDRRYPSAHHFAQDIQRFLANEPVSAGPPSRLYRLGKFFQRHKTAFLTHSVSLSLSAVPLLILMGLMIRSALVESGIEKYHSLTEEAARHVSHFMHFSERSLRTLVENHLLSIRENERDLIRALSHLEEQEAVLYRDIESELDLTKTLREIAVAGNFWTEISLYNFNGDLLASTHDNYGNGKDNLFDRALKKGETVISPPGWSGARGGPRNVVVYHPVKLAEDHPGVIVRGKVLFAPLRDVLADGMRAPGSYLVLLDESGNLLHHPEDRRIMRQANGPAREAFNSGRSYSLTQDDEGNEVFWIAYRLRPQDTRVGEPWTLVAIIPREQVKEGSDFDRFILLAGIAGAIWFLAAASFLLHRHRRRLAPAHLGTGSLRPLPLLI